METGVRKDFYVYFHRDGAGNIFYVGKGTKRRASSLDRHVAWKKYVSERLSGHYTVEIYADGLTELEAEELEFSLIAQYGEQLINWINPGRGFDHSALEQYHKLRDANRKFVADTRELEATNLRLAADRYAHALEAMREYESMTLERGLVAEMDVGPNWGDPNILDRLTLCLAKLGHVREAIAVTDDYFLMFPSALDMSAGKRISARIGKLKDKVSKIAEMTPNNSFKPKPLRGSA